MVWTVRKTDGAEKRRGTCEEVGGIAYLGCGMTLERQACVRLGHALAIVYDLYGGAPGIYYYDVYLGGTGIHGILHKLLDDACRTLNHLACRNLVCH